MHQPPAPLRSRSTLLRRPRTPCRRFSKVSDRRAQAPGKSSSPSSRVAPPLPVERERPPQFNQRALSDAGDPRHPRSRQSSFSETEPTPRANSSANALLAGVFAPWRCGRALGSPGT